ncbi:MAG: glycosyltransferase [Pseudomonadota bacterium]
MAEPRIGAVLIGRNEGTRLTRCLASTVPQVARTVYVDSGSTDGSLDTARAAGADVIELDLSVPFTAARARNAGWQALLQAEDLDYIQFIDGDCELREGWIATALAFLQTHSQAAVACGRRRERFPEATLYNRLCDWEWDTPVGQARACGGDAMMRVQALRDVDGFNPALIAGEEPELCVRLRQAGWQIWRLDAEMTWHDAAITRFGQWWTRARRAGHTYAEGAAMHGAPPERHGVERLRRALIWGAGLPTLTAIAVLLFGPWGLALLLALPAQIVRLALRQGPPWRAALERATFLTLAKVPESLGALAYTVRRIAGRQRARLIEYK